MGSCAKVDSVSNRHRHGHGNLRARLARLRPDRDTKRGWVVNTIGLRSWWNSSNRRSFGRTGRLTDLDFCLQEYLALLLLLPFCFLNTLSV